MKHFKITSLPLLLLLVVLLSVLGAAQSDCRPDSCQARCDGGCKTNQVCTLGTMTECGSCPASKCVDRSVLGLPPQASASTAAGSGESQDKAADNDSGGGSDKGALIGGLVGGLVGGLLLFAGIGCWLARHYKGNVSNLLPFTQQQQLNEKNQPANNNREITSGVIPVTYIPPSPEDPQPPQAAAATLGTAATASSSNDDNDKRSSKYLSAHYDSDGDDTVDTRNSMASTISNQPVTPSKTTYAVQVQRARPQIMRVNQVRVSQDEPGAFGGGLSRSGSVRTILTRDDGSEASSVVHLSRSNTAPARRFLTKSPRQMPQRSPMQQRPTTIINTDPDLLEATLNKNHNNAVNRGSPRSADDPFHDRHSVLIGAMPAVPDHVINDTTAQTGERHHSNATTIDSKIIGDGEITIYWNNAHDEEQNSQQGASSRRLSGSLQPSSSTSAVVTPSHTPPPPPPSRPVSSQHP
ncbi:hypothetical protein BJV82DRAFT_74601 [Fennellomyces sp. T-0311]|nr:hypothetical protein BJV82DRAFT_74601 [Fennellomyces sp. T-0311]